MKTLTISLILAMAALETVQVQGSTCEDTIEIRNGYIKGMEMLDINQKPFCAHKGIPFAKSPEGDLRFKAPQPIENWQGVFTATADSVECPQYESYDEDCLKLNVYSPMNGFDHKPKPVVCIIHGGAFISGSASVENFNPSRIMASERVLLVTIQYRLGALGFLSTNSSDASGNYGLLDQQLALQWIQDNIHYFGGDPKKVTIGGGSAGGISTGYHLISKKSFGFYRAAMIFSGSPLLTHVMTKDPRRHANFLGQALNCPFENSTLLVECLRRKPTQDIIMGSNAVVMLSGKQLPFQPTQEPKEICQFLCDTPLNLFKSGQFNRVPIMIGTTLDETASIILGSGPLQIIKTLPVVPEATISYIFGPLMVQMLSQYSDYTTNLDSLTRAMRQKYSHKANYTNPCQLMDSLINMTTDLAFRAGTDQLVRVLADNNHPAYLYSFDFHGDLSKQKSCNVSKVDHTENGNYFENPYLSDKDKPMGDLLLQHLMDFAEYLCPTPIFRLPETAIWVPSFNVTQLWFMKYGDQGSYLHWDYFTEEMDFWNNDVPKIVSGEMTVN